MRRSTKEFTDAVGEDRFRRNSQVERVDSEEPQSGAEKKKVRTVTVKKEDSDDHSWKALDASEQENIANGSPLGNKSGTHSAELPSSVMTKRKRRTLSSNTFDEPEGPSSSSIAISTLVSGTKRPQNSKRFREAVDTQKYADTDSAKEVTASNDSFEPSNDNPSNSPDDALGPGTIRQSRRNSSKPKKLIQENPAPRKHTFTDTFDDEPDTWREEDDNFTYSKLEGKGTGQSKAGSGASKDRRKVGRAKRDSNIDTPAASEPSTEEELPAHGQRGVASRRRSMMV